MLSSFKILLVNKNHYDYKKLAEIRKTVGTQEEVAKTLGITAVQLSRAENGKSASYELLSAIAGLANADVRGILKPNDTVFCP